MSSVILLLHSCAFMTWTGIF